MRFHTPQYYNMGGGGVTDLGIDPKCSGPSPFAMHKDEVAWGEGVKWWSGAEEGGWLLFPHQLFRGKGQKRF